MKFMNTLGLNYGAIDMIVTPENKFVFLEINPVGEFFWLELNHPYFPISETLADILINQPHPTGRSACS